MLTITSGTFRRVSLKGPKDDRIRPTQQLVRQSLVNYLRDFIDHANVLDLYAGSGITGLELLSNGAHHVTFVDISKQSFMLLEQNIARLDVKKQTQIIQSEAMDFLVKAYRQKLVFDIIFIDPPYEKLKGRSDHHRNDFVLELLDRSADLLTTESVIVLKHPRDFSVPVPRKLQLFEQRTYGLNTLSYLIPKKVEKQEPKLATPQK